LLNKQFYEHIVERYTSKHQQKVTEQLNPPSQIASCKNYVSAEIKANRKSNTKGCQESGNMRTDSKDPDVYHLFLKDKVVTDKEDQNVKNSVKATTRSIPEGLQRHKPSK
jgi:hypothetical protein